MVSSDNAEMVINLLMLLIMAVGQFLLYRSVPQGAVADLLKEARRAAEQTKWGGDDVAVDLAERIAQALIQKKDATLPLE